MPRNNCVDDTNKAKLASCATKRCLRRQASCAGLLSSWGCPMALGVGLRRWPFALLMAVCAFSYAGGACAQRKFSPGYAADDVKLSPSARAGREIWFYATAFNDRFYTYAYPQRLGAAIDWYLVLAAQNKGDLFQAWG